jgi:predicted solute-binding protein
MLHGRQKDFAELSFAVPSVCADRVAAGEADIGIVPVFELLRQDLQTIPGLGIASRGEVRSILLISKVRPEEIRTLAADSSSRTSVQLARVILARKYGAHPAIASHAPELATMLSAADAALVIGDPALRLDPAALPYRVFDLGVEWTELTGLPMVFAIWAGRPGVITPAVTAAFRDSYRQSGEELDAMVAAEAAARDFPPEFVRRYLTTHVVHDLGDAEMRGMSLFLEWAALDREQAA